ncbi:MAG: tetratricopeptide repeat protein [Candidatus Abyssobacteria bacterium SURF_5]|jgi:tetratricopeptide (TPR) repeat protein|uniref:Tetratricopeptide repeat protein n=1 Tax=Abyssobacteria bacterium (strain SURF_5) TaxID=2093360 RepID=A0A3A4NXF4_ABYX5|nr:MAG: tetratricopeptide repeat protein [Candidatus Abyssubacteria bacterium SURF_5]
MKLNRIWLALAAALVLFAGCAEKQPPLFQLIKLFQEEKFDQTIALAEKLTAENPDNSQAHRFLIRAAREQNALNSYKEKYEKLVQENPQIAGYHFGLGYICIQVDEYEKGLAELEKATELNPSIDYAHYAIGWTHLRSNYSNADPEKGLAAWKKEEQLNPKSLGALQVYNDRADYYLRKGDAAAAEKDYEKITLYAFAPGDIAGARTYISQIRTYRDELARLEADVKDKPDDASLRMQLGVLQYKNNKIDEAINTWLKASELQPDNVDVRNYLGKALLERQRFAEAADQFLKVLEIDPNMATAYYNLAVAQELLGKPESAVQNYKKYIELNPMAPKLEDVKQRITNLEDSTGVTEG